MFEPPGAELRERAGQVLWPRRKAVAGSLQEAATPASLDLELGGKRPSFGLGGRLSGFATALAGRISPLRVPDAAALEHTRHQLLASFAPTYHRSRVRHRTERVGLELRRDEAEAPAHSARARQLAALCSLVDP